MVDLPSIELGPVQDFAALRAVPSRTDVNQIISVVYKETVGDGYASWFSYDPESTASDNDANVIKPDDIDSGEPGRWIAFGVTGSGGGGGPGSHQDLEETLGYGNETGGNDIAMSPGDKIVGLDGYVVLDPNAIVEDDLYVGGLNTTPTDVASIGTIRVGETFSIWGKSGADNKAIITFKNGKVNIPNISDELMESILAAVAERFSL